MKGKEHGLLKEKMLCRTQKKKREKEINKREKKMTSWAEKLSDEQQPLL